MEQGKQVFTASEVAATLGISAVRVRALAQDRQIGRKLGRDWLFTPADVEALRQRPDLRKTENRRPQKETGGRTA